MVALLGVLVITAISGCGSASDGGDATAGAEQVDMLRYPDGQDTLHIYAYRNRDPQGWEARAYYGGLIVRSPDHEERTAGFRLAPSLAHELVHVLQWLLTGPDAAPIDTWFIEGLPEAIAGGTTGGVIKSRDRLDDLLAEYGTISPTSVKAYSQIPDPETGERFSYPMFQLATDYLLDEDGYGRSPEDARDVLIDMAEGASFEAAFETHMGTGVDDYDREFFTLMDAYLPRYRSPVFSPVGFAVVSVLVVAVVIGAPTAGYRYWRSDSKGERIGASVPGRRARLVFHGEMVAASALVILFFLAGLFVVGTTPELNNAMYSTARTRMYGLLAGYLVASVGFALWAVHRWTRHNRSAFLVAPLVLVTTGAAALSMDAVSAMS